MVAAAASATVSGVVGMMGSGGGLSLQGSAMKLCNGALIYITEFFALVVSNSVFCSIDQLDKADSPLIPEPYICLLGVQCLCLSAKASPGLYRALS
jgi:hypothetical protein